jgi:hypothetical protein
VDCEDVRSAKGIGPKYSDARRVLLVGVLRRSVLAIAEYFSWNALLPLFHHLIGHLGAILDISTFCAIPRHPWVQIHRHNGREIGIPSEPAPEFIVYYCAHWIVSPEDVNVIAVAVPE